MSTFTTKKLSAHETARILWLARLFREGKLEAYWNARIQIRLKAKGAGGFGDARVIRASHESSELKKEFGWSGINDEMERHRIFLSQPVVNRRKEQMAELQRNKGRSAIEKALSKLPITAPVEQEMAWARAHPKMTRALSDALKKQADDYEPPRPTSSDVVGTYYIPCPSRGAWNILLAALGNPKKFSEQLLSKQKEGAVKNADNAESESNVMDDLGEVERMLNAVQLNG